VRQAILQKIKSDGWGQPCYNIICNSSNLTMNLA
jgi:hypothetical protein